MIADLLYFFSLADANIRSVLLGSILLGISAGVVGCLVVLSKKTLVVDAISHSMLPGICLGFLLSGVKNPIDLLMGGIFSAAVSVFLIAWITKNSKIKNDAAIAISLSLLFALGVVLLNVIQNTGNPNQSGLSDFLFGKAASMVQKDVWVFSVITVFTLVLIPIFYRYFKISLFDAVFSKSIGISKFWVQTLISFLCILVTAAGVQTVGIILMSAMMISPASSALFWTRQFHKMLWMAGLIGALCAIAGVYISYLAPKMPTGPWMVVSLAFVTLLSFLFSPRGSFKKWKNKFKSQKV